MPIMVAVFHGHKSKPALEGFVDGQLHSVFAGNLAERPASVDEGGERRLVNHPDLRPGKHHAGFEAVVVPSQAGHAMRFDAPQIRQHQNLRRGMGILCGDPHFFKDLLAEPGEGFRPHDPEVRLHSNHLPF